MGTRDERIGRTLPVVAPHAGHTITVVRTAEAEGKPQAYVVRCECGTEALIGSYWLDRALKRGTFAHGAILQPGEVDAVGLLDKASRVVTD